MLIGTMSPVVIVLNSVADIRAHTVAHTCMVMECMKTMVMEDGITL